MLVDAGHTSVLKVNKISNPLTRKQTSRHYTNKAIILISNIVLCFITLPYMGYIQFYASHKILNQFTVDSMGVHIFNFYWYTYSS